MSNEKNMNVESGITRRTFLKGAAAGVAAASVASVIPAAPAEAAILPTAVMGNVKKYKKMAAQELPTEVPDYVIDPLNQFGTYFTGMLTGNVTLKSSGDVRSYKIYVPEGCRRDASSYFIAVPDGIETTIFLQASGWIEIADKDKVVLSVFEPANKKWGSWDVEKEYFSTAYSQFSGTTHVYHDIFNWRWVGYGKGGAMMQRHTMLNPMTCSALAVIGGSTGITEAEMAEYGATPFVAGGKVQPITYGEAAVPVFIAEPVINKKVQKVIDYWKKANDVKEEKIALGAGYVYYQKPFSANLFTYDQKCGTVRVLPGAICYTDKKLAKAAYDFVSLYARSGTGSPYSNSLTYAVSDDTFIREEYIIDGYQREWFTYLPTRYNPEGDPMPLVIFFHGTGQSGLLASRQGDWWKLGEEKDFIAVCPSASLEKKRSPGKVPQMSWNVEDYGNADEIVFVDEMIKILKSEYNIDGGRVYVTGQSNGGRMSIYAGLALPHVVTAVGSQGASALTTGATLDEYFLPKELDESAIVPFLATIGEYDNFKFDIDAEGSDSWVRCHYYCNRYNLDYNKRLEYKNCRNTHTIWETSAGVPLQEQLIIGRRAHSNRPVECDILWNEWFAYFNRDEATSDLYYMGKKVELD